MLTLVLTNDDVALRWARLVAAALGSGRERVCGDGASAFAVMERERVDLVVIGRGARADDALAFVRATRAHPAHAHVPVVLTSSTACPRSRRDGLEAGAIGVFSLRDEPEEVAAWLSSLLALMDANRARGVTDRGPVLGSSDVNEASSDTDREVLLILARMVEYRDNDTGDHTLRVARHSEMLAKQLGLPTAFCQAIRLAAPLHDIGKVAIPDALLLKPGRLDEDEMAVVRTHAEIGERILGGSACGLIRLAAEIAGHHHERWDGTGYPRRVSGTDIPLSARIVAVADVFDAMTSERPYKAALPIEQALAHVEAEAGRHFDPACADAFVKAYRTQHAFFHPHVDGPRRQVQLLRPQVPPPPTYDVGRRQSLVGAPRMGEGLRERAASIAIGAGRPD